MPLHALLSITQRAQMVMGGKQLPDYRNTWQEPEAGAGEAEEIRTDQ